MTKKKNKLRLGLPKGSLEEATIQLFKDAGYTFEIKNRSYRPKLDDLEIDCFLIRAQEIPKYVEKGFLDLGLTGKDMIVENRAKVVELIKLNYMKGKLGGLKWVLAVAKNSKIRSVRDLEGKLISTEVVNITKDYLKKNKIKAKVEFSWGTTEVKPPQFVDAIVDNTETGSTLKAHNLKIIDVVFETSPIVITNKEILKNKWKKKKIEALVMLLKGALNAKERDGALLVFHIPGGKLERILKILPKSKRPTVQKLVDIDWYEATIGCDKLVSRELIPRLKRLGCQGIVEFPLNKAIL